MEDKAVAAYLRPLNAVLVVLTIGGAAYLGFMVFSMYQALGRLDAGMNAVKRSATRMPAFPLAAQPDETLLEAIRGRDLFSAAQPQPSAQEAPTGQLPPNLKVVAILISEAPQVVIEDSSAQRTYFVAEGKPDGGIALRHADRHTVIIDYQGQNISVPVSEPAQPRAPTNVAIP